MDADAHYAEYSFARLQQLRKGNFKFWVFRGDALDCAEQHRQLDGLALPPGHPFWRRYYPPLDSQCRCYVLGARSKKGVIRLGGDPDKQIPAWCLLLD